MTEKTQNKDTINAENAKIKPKLYFALAEDTPQVWLSMSREEAIYRIAKTIFGYEVGRIEYRKAEAALDALLGD